MSRPNWEEMGDRCGAQAAQYNAPRLGEGCPECPQQAGEPPCIACLEDWGREHVWWGPAELAEDVAGRLPVGEQPPVCDLLTLSRAQQDAGAAQDGQALIAGTVWLVIVVVCVAVTLAVFGAAWVNMLWLAPFGGR